MKEFDGPITANFSQVNQQGKIFAVRQPFDFFSKNLRGPFARNLLIEIFFN